MATRATPLTNGKPTGARAPSLLQRGRGIVDALVVIGALYACGLPGAVLQQLRAAFAALAAPSSPAFRLLTAALIWFNPLKWRDAIVANGLPVLLVQSDNNSGHLKRNTIFPYAKGKTLEMGAGTGMSVKYYDAEKISELYLVEPMVELHAALRKSIAAAPGLSTKTKIVHCGIESRKELGNHGITAGSLDTITLVQVLCSIPEPEKHLAFLQSLLKPGGQLLLFEHVVSDDAITAHLQHLWNPVWTRLSGGCNVNRDSAARVAALGAWSSMEITRPDEEHRGDFYPHALARFVKA